MRHLLILFCTLIPLLSYSQNPSYTVSNGYWNTNAIWVCNTSCPTNKPSWVDFTSTIPEEDTVYVEGNVYMPGGSTINVEGVLIITSSAVLSIDEATTLNVRTGGILIINGSYNGDPGGDIILRDESTTVINGSVDIYSDFYGELTIYMGANLTIGSGGIVNIY